MQVVLFFALLLIAICIAELITKEVQKEIKARKREAQLRRWMTQDSIVNARKDK